ACLLTAAGGQRWMTTPVDGAKPGKRAAGDDRRVCTGHAEAATVVAPDSLLGIVRRKDGRFAFVGASGTIYEADKPLGPFTHTEAAPVPMSRVVGVGGRFVGLTPGGELFAWEEGRGFRALPEPAARFVDVAADPRGRLLALAVPEALFASDDGGATFGPV